MLLLNKLLIQCPLRAVITHAYCMDEEQCVVKLLELAQLPEGMSKRVEQRARELVMAIRKKGLGKTGIEAFMYQYHLSSEEGITLLSLAEALLRVPDKHTMDKLIRDKLLTPNWRAHTGKGESLLVNAATWGLVLTGKVLQRDGQENKEHNLPAIFKRAVARASAPVIRKTIQKMMQELGHHFVMGRTIEEALHNSAKYEKQGYQYSYDMLGEAARTAQDAENYFTAYEYAINALTDIKSQASIVDRPGISVKLSALHPRYEFAQQEIVLPLLIERVKNLALQAKNAGINFTIDAEEAERLDISLDIIEAIVSDSQFNGWDGFGLAVQAYQKRAPFVIDWLQTIARQYKRKLMVRLVKGAYWDTEIKLAQVKGLAGYPVYTRKMTTDVAYIACAKKMLAAPDVFYSQFATHNAYSIAVILELAGQRRDFEFQCLHGMGLGLYDQLLESNQGYHCRIYAPVGSYHDLLPYLVRRLLENGANSSFLNQVVDKSISIEELVMDPIKRLAVLVSKPHVKIPLPKNIYGKERKNSYAMDLTNIAELRTLVEVMQAFEQKQWWAAPTIKSAATAELSVCNPSDQRCVVGKVIEATKADVDVALNAATAAGAKWNATSVTERAACLGRAADLFEQHMPELILIAIREAGKTAATAVAEVREAIDFCRYYAVEARKQMQPMKLSGPTGEENILQLSGRGVAVCISPWNFPLAIFTGQITAALVTGNTVIAKPAEQTPLMAARAVELLHIAGIPHDVLQLLPGKGEVVGAALVGDARVSTVIFTGSTETARLINQTLAQRQGPIAQLIAETGGQNAMIVDSTALPEQVVVDVLTSAFDSAGQRCSAVRLLFLQAEIADTTIAMLKGAMAEIKLGDPAWLATDIGPVIDQDAKERLEKHVQDLEQMGASLIYQVPLSKDTDHGFYFAPCAYEIADLNLLKREVFGPILHVIRYKQAELDKVIDAINATGYGLTLGIHSRIGETIDYVSRRVQVGNIYVNRNMIGAVVGVQPFGGQGLSGTGPKAGGPHYLARFCVEKTVSINTMATGGNTALLALEE